MATWTAPNGAEFDLSDNMHRAAAYYLVAHLQNRRGNFTRPPMVPARVRIIRRVTGDPPLGHGTVIDPGEYNAHCNRWGAVSVVASDGNLLGLRLDEFEPIAWRKNHPDDEDDEWIIRSRVDITGFTLFPRSFPCTSCLTKPTMTR